MAEVTVTINGREYQVACDDGQEEHLQKLSRFVDKKMGDLAGSLGQIGDARLLVMASLLVADELSDAYRQLETLEAGNDGEASGSAEKAMGPTLDACAQRIEDIATRLEGV
ncbi:MAG: cell division protein ZapA [Kiloniellales bacterium]